MSLSKYLDQRYEKIIINLREYITTLRLFRDLESPFSTVYNLNRAISNMETYQELIDNGHIVIVDMSYCIKKSHAKLEGLVKSNSYKAVWLIDAVAQKSIEHHIKETASKAVKSAKENALLSLADINLEILSKDPSNIILLKALSKAEEAKQLAIDIKNELASMASKMESMPKEIEKASYVAWKKRLSHTEFHKPVISISDLERRYYARGISLKKISKILKWYGADMCKALRNDSEYDNDCKPYWASQYVDDGLESIFIKFFAESIPEKSGMRVKFIHKAFGCNRLGEVRSAIIDLSVNKLAMDRYSNNI